MIYGSLLSPMLVQVRGTEELTACYKIFIMKVITCIVGGRDENG